MTTWTEEELGRIGAARELQLASSRSDGTRRPYVTMWVVRADGELYVRSVYGPNNRGSAGPGPAAPAASGPVAWSGT